MKALLLAAGLGTRLRPLTDHLPKCLVPIHRQPLLGIWLDLLFSGGISQVIINTHYYAEQVQHFIQACEWREKIVLVHEDALLGTGGTVLSNRHLLAAGPFLLAHADNLTRFNVRDFIVAHENRKSGIEITMMTFDTDVPQSCGIVEVDDDNTVVGFHEKSPIFRGRRANAAVYIVEPSVIDFLASLQKSVIDLSTEVLPHFLGRMQTFHNSDYHRDIGSPESLRLAMQEYVF